MNDVEIVNNVTKQTNKRWIDRSIDRGNGEIQTAVLLVFVLVLVLVLIVLVCTVSRIHYRNKNSIGFRSSEMIESRQRYCTCSAGVTDDYYYFAD